jgi:hypothetical protein
MDYAPVVMVNWEFFDNQTPSIRARPRRWFTRRTDADADARRAAVHLQGDRESPCGPA